MSQQAMITELNPRLATDLAFSTQIMSQRFQGSFHLALRKVSRLPSYSRAYSKGDPVQLIDWKAYARNDQLIVREDRDEASCRVMFCIDTSSTVFWPEQKTLHNEPQKWEVICRIALHLAYVHLKLGDTVHFYFIGEDQPEPSMVFRWEGAQELLSRFVNLEENNFPKDMMLEGAEPSNVPRRQYQLGYLLSDCLNHRHEDWLDSYAKRGRLFHVMSSLEWNLDWLQGNFCYFDESGEKKEFLGTKLKGANFYLKTLEEWVGKTQKRLRNKGFDYFQVTDRTSINQYLTVLSTPLQGG